MAKNLSLAQKILDTALALGEAQHWEKVRLHDVADALNLSLEDIRVHYREKEDLVEAWFDRADSAMLREASKAGFLKLSARERLHWLIMIWLEALASHRRTTRQMILNKLEPGHVHIQIPAVLRVSRTVQWIREAARRDATFLFRAIEETALTSVYLVTFLYWMRDDSPNAWNTRRLLDRLLSLAQPIIGFGGAKEPATQAMASAVEEQQR